MDEVSFRKRLIIRYLGEKSHEYRAIFGFIVIENMMELIPELMFAANVVLDGGWGVSKSNPAR